MMIHVQHTGVARRAVVDEDEVFRIDHFDAIAQVAFFEGRKTFLHRFIVIFQTLKLILLIWFSEMVRQDSEKF